MISQMTSKLDLNDYYKWASGNLADNRNRGILAEWLVGKAPMHSIRRYTSRMGMELILCIRI